MSRRILIAVVAASGLWLGGASTAKAQLSLLAADEIYQSTYNGLLNNYNAYVAMPNGYSQYAAVYSYYAYQQAYVQYNQFLHGTLDIEGWKTVKTYNYSASIMAYINWKTKAYSYDAYYGYYYSWMAYYYCAATNLI